MYNLPHERSVAGLSFLVSDVSKHFFPQSSWCFFNDRKYAEKKRMISYSSEYTY